VNESATSEPLNAYLTLGPAPAAALNSAAGREVQGDKEREQPRYRLDVAAALGTLVPLPAAGEASGAAPAAGVGSWSATGTLAELEAALAVIGYRPPNGWNSARLPRRAARLGATLALIIEPSASAAMAGDSAEAEAAAVDPALGPAATAMLEVRVAAVNDPPVWRVAPTAGLRTAEGTPLRLGGAVAVVDADVGEAGGVGDGLVAVRERRRERGLPSSQRPSSRNNIFTGSFALSAYTSGTAASLSLACCPHAPVRGTRCGSRWRTAR
jgi:hypothetical protein